MGKPSKIKYLILRVFWQLLSLFNFCKEDWAFDIFLIFPNFLSPTSFGNSWGNSFTKFFMLDIKYCFTCDDSDKELFRWNKNLIKNSRPLWQTQTLSLNRLKIERQALSTWDTNTWSDFYDTHSELICHNKWHPRTSEISTPLEMSPHHSRVQPKNTYSSILKETSQVWESQKRISINTNHSCH